MLAIAVGPANVQDRDGAPDLVRDARRLFPWLAHLFADQAYAGPRFASALGLLSLLGWRRKRNIAAV